MLNSIGTFNSFFGLGCGEQNTEGHSNSFFGGFAGQQNIAGSHNAMFGNSSGQLIVEGDCNSFFGETCAAFKKSGNNNTYIGHHAANNDTSGINNTIIGKDADFSDGIDSLDHAIAIGFNARVGCHNCAVIGGTGADSVNVGIGTANPSSRLEVNGGNITVINGSFFDDGMVLNVPDYVFQEGYNLKSLEEVSNYISEKSHLEGFPSMHDNDGWAKMSLQKRDMKMLEKVEELFLHTINQEETIQEQEIQIQKLSKELEQMNSELTEFKASFIQFMKNNSEE